jgi:curved DNA-binding protein CbpA
VTASSVLPDYYAVLQVHPDADFEVIEAAYRQLMKKHHPDMAGDDPERIAAHLTRAKAMNQAWSVLRDPEQRRRYDLARLINGTVPPRPSPPPRTPPHSSGRTPPRGTARPASPPQGHGPTGAAASPSGQGWTGPANSGSGQSWTASAAQTSAADQPHAAVHIASPPARLPGWLMAPITLFSAAYYLLPGPYEWEPGSGRDLVAVSLLPIFGIAAYALLTGRLAPLVGHSPTATIAVGAILVLCIVVSMWGSLLRVTAASLPSLLLLTGLLNPVLNQAHVPIWLAWGLLSCLSLIFAARLFVFGVLPTLGMIWFITRP